MTGAAGTSPEALFQQFRDPIVRYFLRRRLPLEAAEDCAQETFARIVRSGATARVGNPEAYLFVTAANVFNDRQRKARVRHEDAHVPIDDYRAASDEPSAVRVLEGKEGLRKLAEAMAGLTPRTREIFLLNRLEGLNYTQLAARFGVTVSAIEKQMAKALIHLREQVRKG